MLGMQSVPVHNGSSGVLKMRAVSMEVTLSVEWFLIQIVVVI